MAQVTEHELETITTAADDELPDPRLFWRWVGRAVEPYAGWVSMIVGALLILLGYLGVSREALVAKQLPYLISGGIGGVALVGLGGAYITLSGLRHDSGRLDRLERMVHELHLVLLARPDAPAPVAPESASATTNGRPSLVALPVGQTYHRSDCSMVQGKANAEVITERAARQRGLRPCRMCEPEQIESAVRS
jgi:hypothetical protein